jgi:hypothetical protein
MSAKKKALTLFTLTLLITTTVGQLLVNSANAIDRTVLPTIEINSDGTITPDTGYITRNGNTYTLTTDITDRYSIRILCSNITFDGQGHTIRITNAQNINVLQNVTNVTVKNLRVHNNADSFSLADCYNCTISNVTTNYQIDVGGKFNTVTQCSGGVALEGGSENMIFRNNISYIYIFDAPLNRFFENNIRLSGAPGICSDNFWDNGSIGNYWSDYALKYPNATEKDNSGVSNTPYTVERADYSIKENPNAVNIDHYPLMYPVNIEDSTVALPAHEPSGDSFLPVYIIGVFVASIILASIGLALYKRKKAPGNREIVKDAQRL